MNYAGKFGSGGLDSHSTAPVDIDSLSHRGDADTVTIRDAHLLFGGDYERSGADLIVSDHDHRVVVPNYFLGDKHPTLVSPDGAALDPKVIEALTGHVQYAQASGAAAAAKVVGHVIKMTGSASVVRNGVTVTLNEGENVLQNDVVQTGSGSTLGLVMIDGTTFNLTAGARLMLNDLTYDANSTSNTSLFTLVQGAASFVAGQVAKTGDMKVGTPVATMGIRGTAVILDISTVDGRLSISVVDQRDGQVHAVQVFNARGTLIGTVTSNGTGLTLTPIANFEVIAQASDKTVAQIALEFNALQTLLQTYNDALRQFPNLPQHTDANPQSSTRYASSAPADSPSTERTPFVNTPGSTPAGTGTPVTVALSLPTDTAPIGSTTPPAAPVQVAVPVTPLPFVVTPPTISRVSSGGGDHFGPVMSADGQYIVYDPDGAIYLYDRQTNTTITIAAPGGGFTYSGQTISADGHHVVFQGTDGANSYVFIYNNDPSDTAHYQHTIQLVAGGAPAISGDGSTIVVEHGGNSIGIYDQQGHAIATITPAAIGASGTVWRPAISADGHVIAFWSTDAAAPGGSGHLFTYDRSTGIATEIASTATDAGTSAASFSADGRYVVYQSDTPVGHSEIYLYDLSTGQVVFHTANALGASYNPVISPDGHFIIFASAAQLVPDGDTNSVTDTYVVDVTDPNHPIYTLVSNLGNGTQPDAASNLGAAISAGGLFIAFGSSASNLSQGDTPGTGDIFVVDSTSGRSAIILESANSPAVLTAGGVIALAGDHNGVTLGVSDPTGRFTASFNAQGNIEWHFSEPRSDFAALLPGQISTQNFVITLSNSVGTTTIPVRVSVYDADQPTVTVVDAAPHAAPVALAQGAEDTSFTITAAALLAGVVDIDTPLSSLFITDVTIQSGGGSLYHNENGTWTYTPAANFNGMVVFNYTVSDGSKTASSTASLNIAAVNDAPVAVADVAAGTENQTLTIDVLANDTDVDDGHVFTLNAVSAPSGNGTARVVGNQVQFNPGTAFDHLAQGAVEHVTLSYTMQDEFGATATSTVDVTITGTNDAPTLTATAANPTFTEAPGLGTQAAPVPMFSGAHSSTIDAGQAITGLTFNVSGLVDGVNERVIVDGTTIALGSASTGSTSSGLTYTVAIAGGTATVALSSAGGISAAAADTLVNSIAYQDSSTDAPTAGDRTFTLTQITDSGGTLNTTALSIASTVHLVAVNDAPVNSVPGAQTVAEDTANVFSSANGNAISISDVDVGAGNETVTVAVTNGALTLAGTAGLSFSMGDGTADTTMTFSGTVSAINTALNGLNYVPTANFNGGATLTVTTNDNGNTGGGSRTDIDTVAITVTPVEDAPAITGTTATGSVPSSALTATAASYLTAGSSLVNGLGGAAGFGDTAIFRDTASSAGSPRSDDGSTSAIDLTHVFGASGLNFFGHTYTSLYINNNGNITFAAPYSSFTPATITADGRAIIAPFWADVDTQGGATAATTGGNSTGSNLVYQSLDTVNHVLTITWDDVGYFSAHTNPSNAFQLQLIGLGNGDFDIVFRYESINWTTGDFSGGSGGLGERTPARAGYSAGDGNPSHYFEIPASGHQSQMLALDTTTGNTGIAGVDVFQVQSGNVTSAPIANGTVQFADPDATDIHTASFTPGGTGYHGTFTLDPVSETGGNGSVAWHFALTNVEINNIAIGVPLVQNYTIAVNDGHAGITTQTVSVSVGSSGADTLNAGHAADVLIGAGGNDNFAFGSTSVGNETIVDFTHGADLLQISVAGAGFAGHGLVANATATVINAASVGAATGGTNGDFIFDTTAHSLYWDANGGSGADAVLLAHLQNVNSLSASDFHLV